jgi:hypothetical protein
MERINVKEVKVFVNLEEEEAIIQTIRRINLFDNPAKRFIIEGDSGGFSAIEKRQNGFYLVNYLRGKEKPIEERRLTEEEVKKLIRRILEEKYT